jgi:hypothetical protein
MSKKWSERKAPGRFLRGRDERVGDEFVALITAIGEEELERDGKMQLKTILSLTRPGIGPWGDLVCNQGNLDSLAALFGDDDSDAAIGQQILVRVVMTGKGNGFQIGPVSHRPARAAPPRPEPPAANLRPRQAPPPAVGNGQEPKDDLDELLQDEIPSFDPPAPAVEPAAQKEGRRPGRPRKETR